MSYRIDVLRHGKDKGDLTYFQDDKQVVKTTCWFDPQVRIPAKTYTGCSATYMTRAYATKADGSIDWSKVIDPSWLAIFLPDQQTGIKGIFIHQGTGADWSDGCIVIAFGELQNIWNSITPRDGRNVTIAVRDK